jgi:tetratricopeptide (TPR) repeat protein
MVNNHYKEIQKRAALRQTQLFLEKVKRWSTEFATPKTPEIFKQMDEEKGNLKKALARLPDFYDQIPEQIRDFSLLIYDYYSTRSRWDEWIEFGELGLKACEKLGDQYSLGQVYSQLCNYLGIAHRMMNKFDEAMEYYKKAFNKAERNEEKSDALTSMADIYRLKFPPETEKALQSSEEAIKLAQEIGDKNREAKSWEYKGLAYVGLGREGYDDGINCYKKALALRKETENLPGVAKMLSTFIFALVNRGSNEDINQAIEYYEKAYEIEKSLDNQQSLGRLDGDIAVAYNKLGKYKEAIEFSRNAATSNENAKYWRAYTLNQARLLHSYFGLKNVEEALKCADYVCENQKKLTAFDLANLPDLSGMFVELAKYQQERVNIEKAKEYCQFAINLATATFESESLQSAELLLKQLS